MAKPLSEILTTLPTLQEAENQTSHLPTSNELTESVGLPKTPKSAIEQCKQACNGVENCPCNGAVLFQPEDETQPIFTLCVEYRAYAKQRELENRIRSVVPKNFWSMSFDGFDTGDHPDLIKAKKWSMAYVEREAWAKGGCFILSGGYGCGKTHLAAAIARAVVAKGSTVAFQLAANLAALKFNDMEDTFTHLREVDLLILDDIANEFVSDARFGQVAQRLFSTIDHRYMENKGIVITTNVSANDIPKVLGNRNADRMRERAAFLSISAPSYRAHLRPQHTDWTKDI